MPGPPAPFVPTPLPNIGKTGSSPQNYSTTVTFEGQAVAIKGATFASMGDVASQGTGGGIVSANVEGPTKFIGPGSMNVKVEGKNVHLLGDQMLNNCGPSGSPPNSATMAGVLQSILASAQATETPTTACSSGGAHAWKCQPARGARSLDDKINDAVAAPNAGARFEGAAAAHNKSSGDLQRSDQMSGDTDAEKVWWVCSICGFKREGDQTHDGVGGGTRVAVEAKAKTKLSARDARQLGRNCQAVAQGGASALVYKVPAGPQANWLVSHVRNVGKAMGVVIKVVRV
jgi:uncharacterized Zn-binding protein involved in type VI secretion